MWLALDTATDRASLALGTPGAPQVEETITGARRHAGALLPAIQSLLQRAGTTLDQLSGLVLSDGPGSFTGLRVGASLVKALVQARRVPLWTAPSLMTRAAGVARHGELVLAVADALRGEVYAAAYRFFPDRVETELAPTVRKPDDLIASSMRPSIVVGDAAADVVARLQAWIGRRIIGPPDGWPSAARLLELVGPPGGAVEIQSVRDWEPAYGRPAEAQARWESAHGRRLPDSVGSCG
jgi:tRNA threonylcarbamoyladenosine biosynthesis protein TsaB